MIKKSEEFDKWLKLKEYSENTCRDYEQRVCHFIECTNGNVIQNKVDRYFMMLRKNFSNKTLNCYRDAVNAYCRFKELNLTIPRRLKEEKLISNIITIDEFEGNIIWHLLDLFRDPTKPIAIVDLIFKSGLRKSEICELKRKDIDLKGLMGKVYRPKENDWHIFLFDSISATRMNKYFLWYPEEKNAFNTSRGRINYMFEKLNKRLKISPSMLRRSLAARLLSEGVKHKHVQDILGRHNRSSTTQRSKVGTESLKKIYLEAMKKSWDKKMKKKIKLS